eukprot:300574-Pyramimonas_sp.AAC.1
MPFYLVKLELESGVPVLYAHPLWTFQKFRGEMYTQLRVMGLHQINTKLRPLVTLYATAASRRCWMVPSSLYNGTRCSDSVQYRMQSTQHHESTRVHPSEDESDGSAS